MFALAQGVSPLGEGTCLYYAVLSESLFSICLVRILFYSRWGILSLYFYGMFGLRAETAIVCIYICIYTYMYLYIPTADRQRMDKGWMAGGRWMDAGQTVDLMYGFPKLVCMMGF